MTTGSGKKTPKTPKTPKKPKSGKASASRSQRKKVVDKTPDSVAIDKDKMAAFFSAAGIESKETGEVKVAKKAAVKKAEDKVSEVASTAKVSVATIVESVAPVAVAAETATASSANEGEPVATESGSLNNTDTLNDNNNKNNNEKGESLMTTNPKAAGNGTGSGSFNTLSMFFVLVVLALFWFYFISSHPQKKAAEIQVKQGKTEILTLTTKIKVLEAENSQLKSNLKHLKKTILKGKKAAKRVNKPLTIGVIPAKNAVAEAAPEDSAAPTSVIKRDSSFDKVPTPFWRNMGPRGSLIKKAPEKAKPAVKIPATKVDSFSKAPKPFWLTPRVKPAAAKVEKQSVISAPPAVKCPCKYRKAPAPQTPAPTLDPSFKKAPKPFWIKN